MIFISSFCRGAKNIKIALQELVNAGIRNIELNSGKKCIINVTKVLEKFKRKYDLNFLIHNYFPPPEDSFVLNLASQNQIILTRTIEHCKNAIKLAGKLKAPIYSVHAGIRLDPHPCELGKPIKLTNIVPYEKAYQTLVHSLAVLCDYALDFDVEIAVENNVLAPFNLKNGKNTRSFICESDEFIRLFKDMQGTNLKALIDVGHLNVTSITLGFNKIDFINTLKEKISLFHLSGNNGVEDIHGMIDEHSWFWDVLRNFRNAKFVIESHNITVEQIKLAEQICREKLLRRS